MALCFTARSRRICGVLLANVFLCAGCLLKSPKKLINPKLTIAINVAPDVNSNSPVAFDVVEINDKDLAKQVAQMTAADWFQKREQIERDFPKSGLIAVRDWEWVPGQVVQTVEIPMRKAPRALLAFANYASGGPHRVKLDPGKAVLISLDRDDFTLSVFDNKPKSDKIKP